MRSGSYNVSLYGLLSSEETISKTGETPHSLVWTNIRGNYTTGTVDSFNVRIDGKDYSYPADRCR